MHVDTLTRKRAKALRRALTDAERILWSRLQKNQLGWQFRVQHPVGPYIADFACVKLRLLIEIDGATHCTLPERLHDERRARFLAGDGWEILRFWNDDVYRNLDGVLRTVAERLPPPSRRLRRRSTSPSPAD